MSLTRTQLIDEFASMDAELLRLEVSGEPEEAFRKVFERMVNTSTRTVGQRDRLWWWRELYAAMDRRAERRLSSSCAAAFGPAPNAMATELRGMRACAVSPT
jgi:hypothetical protein